MSDVIFSIFPNEGFVDLKLYQFGREACDPSHSFGPARRNHFLFHYVLNGCGTLMADPARGDTRTYHIRSGQGFMIFPHQINTYVADDTHPWEYIWLEFDGLRVQTLLDAAGFSPDSPVYHDHSKTLREQMVQEMAYIVDHRDASPFHLIGHLFLFLDYLMRSVEPAGLTTGSELRDSYIHEAITYIEKNFQNDISIEDIAKVLGLNRSYFGKIFKKALGKTPQHFLMQYRMIKAAELIKLSDMSLADIGNAVGYPNPLHFSRAFKTIHGISPREWKKEHKGEGPFLQQ